ncbi:MAG: 30S ribosomal protein S20 [Desulfobacterales bacterium]|nr:30S ribosomal protein S20 [Desulfobacterales bacterium]
MANHKSALKRAHQNEKRRLRNKGVKTRVKSIVRAVRTAGDDAAEKLDEAKSVIDKAAKRGVIHKRTASRSISRLAKHVNSVSK